MGTIAVRFQIKRSSLTYFLAKFDLPCIIGLLYGHCKSQQFDFNTMKKGTKYINAEITRPDMGRNRSIVFRDCLNYTAPCSMDKYCRQWGAKLTKSIFPYSLYSSVEELKSATSFPKYEQFFSELKQVEQII